MSAIIGASRGDNCPICLESFDEAGPPPVTHAGGEKHGGFHKKCLAQWVKQGGTCPFCRAEMDRNGLLSRTERIIEKIMEGLQEFARASSLRTVELGLVISGAKEKLMGLLLRSTVAAMLWTRNKVKSPSLPPIRRIE